MRGTCEHGKAKVGEYCVACDEARPLYERLTRPVKDQVSFLEAIGQRVVDTFAQGHEGIAGVYPVFVGTKAELGKGHIELELQRNWKDGYGDGPPAKLVIQVSVKHTQPLWRRALSALRRKPRVQAQTQA
jgi:hypothetical protein